MVSRYSIIQYVPNPIADERINIGVVAFNEDAVRTHFLSNWERVRYFGMEDTEFLKKLLRVGFCFQVTNMTQFQAMNGFPR